MKRVAIIGGGASGMMAAITAARNKASVTLLEQNDRIGKKILATGNGKCNFANKNLSKDCFYSDTPEFPECILEQFSLQKTLSFFEDLGLCVKDKNGYLYPMSEQATAVLDVLRLEIVRLGISVIKESKVTVLKQKNGAYEIPLASETLEFDSVIIACGSKAAPKTGSNGSGYLLAEKLGHSIIEPLPALVQLRCRESFFKGIAGVRMEAGVTLLVNGEKRDCDRGELQMTEYGISGIPVFQISRNAVKALYQKKKVQVMIDFLPQIPTEKIDAVAETRMEKNKHKSAEEFFYGMLPKKMIVMLLKESKLEVTKSVKQISTDEMKRMLHSWKHFCVTVTAANSFEQAQVCSGGVDVKELTNQMESKKKKGIYFAGEIVDVDGKCGGYNLQWAWSSGYVAGLWASQ